MQEKSDSMVEAEDNPFKQRPIHYKPFPVRFLQIFLLFLTVGLGVSMTSMYTIRHFQNQSELPAVHSITTATACIQEPLSVKSSSRPPSKLLHNMSDAQLLWRASFATTIKSYPFKRVPKMAFMFLTKGPLPMAPLWDKFFKGHERLYSIYIHSLPNYRPDFPPSSVFYRRQIPSKVAEWGEMSMCDAERRLLANALLDISNEWFILVSEACIPLKNFTITYSYISKSRHSFMGSFDELGPDGRGRYSRDMAPLVKLRNWRKGAQWFEVDRLLAVKIVEDTTYYPVFKNFCRPPCYADEHYLPTFLTKKSPHLLANRTITYTDWTRAGAHPATFGKEDVKERLFKFIIEQQNCRYNDQNTSLCYLFARKFAPNTLETLLNVSSKFLGF